jgi:hypothetical protein
MEDLIMAHMSRTRVENWAKGKGSSWGRLVVAWSIIGSINNGGAESVIYVTAELLLYTKSFTSKIAFFKIRMLSLIT